MKAFCMVLLVALTLQLNLLQHDLPGRQILFDMNYIIHDPYSDAYWG
jgi:hypothetical protein